MIGKKFITESGLKICVIGIKMKSNYSMSSNYYCIAINEQGDCGLITLTKDELNKLKEIKEDN